MVSRAALRGRLRVGSCPVCVATGRRGRTLFVITGASLRESTTCVVCRSNARNRAVVVSLDRASAGWKAGTVLEIGAGGALTSALARACSTHIPSQFLAGVPRGDRVGAIRSEDMEKLTLAASSVDVVISEDVLEHVLRPWQAVAEVERVLRPGGVHVFTVPYYADRPETRARVCVNEDGTVEHLLPPEHHGDPINPEGALVVTDFGVDLPSRVQESSGLPTTLVEVFAPGWGILEPCSVFISRKPRTAAESRTK